VDNGFIPSQSDPCWIHNNNNTFVSSNEFLSTAEYAFIVLRCPYRRLASLFLDKIVSRDHLARSLEKDLHRKLWVKYVTVKPIFRYSFFDFVSKVALTPRERMNHHWRPQSDFLVYENYDDWFCIEEFSTAEKTLENKLGLKLLDVRSQIGQSTSHFNKVTGEFARTPLHEIQNMKGHGMIPTYESLYDAKVKEIVDKIYREDIELYLSHFGTSKLLFSL